MQYKKIDAFVKTPFEQIAPNKISQLPRKKSFFGVFTRPSKLIAEDNRLMLKLYDQNVIFPLLENNFLILARGSVRMNEHLAVYVIDDCHIMAKNLRFLLQKLDFHKISIFEDARIALSQLEDEPVDLILVDQDMPYMSGLEFLHKARNILPKTKIILVTACSDVQTISGAIEGGANGYIIKPVCLAVLENKINGIFKEQREDQDRIGRLEKEIRKTLQRKESAVALTMCEDLLESLPNQGNLLLMAGQAHEGLGEMKEAISCFERVQKITHSQMPLPLELLAHIEAKQGNLEKSIEYMEQSLAVSHSLFANPRLFFMAKLLMQAGRYEEAVETAQKVTQIDEPLFCQAQKLINNITDRIKNTVI